MTNPLSLELEAWGATYTPVVVPPGEEYWRLIKATGPVDIGGNHHIYVDTLDEAGNRVVGVRVGFYSQHEDWPVPSEAKPGEPYAANLPMYAGGHAYGVCINDVIESDHLWGLGMPDHQVHHCFTAIFQRTKADGATVPVPPSEPPAEMDAYRALEQAINYMAQAQQLIDFAMEKLKP